MRASVLPGEQSGVPPPQLPLRFGGYALDLNSCTLEDSRGSEIKLTPAELVLLSEFLRHPGRVLSRDHLSNVLLGHGSEPYERGIDMHIVRLRRKIEADPKHPNVILTVPGFGYKFVVKPQTVPAPSVTSAPTIELPLMAVLPFSSLSKDSAQEHLADVLSREVATILATFPSIRVVADPVLGARYVLGGSISREDARLRVMAQLMDAASGEQLWARRYDENSEDTAAQQSYVTESIGYTLAGTLGVIINEEGRRAWRKSPAELTEYDYHARALTMRYRRSREDYGPLREVWNEGLNRFPESALLRIAMAHSYQHEVENLSAHDPIGNIEQAWKLAAEADSRAGLSPLTAMSHCWLMASLCQWYEGNFDRSIALARLTLRMAPYHVRARSHLSWYLANAGRINEAIDWAAWAIRYNPRHGFACNLAWAYYLAGRYQDAMTTLDEVGTEHIPQRAAVLVRLGRIVEAQTAIANWLKSFPHVSIGYMALEAIKEPWKQRWLDDLRIAGVPES